MYQVTYNSVAQAIESNSRCFRAILDFGDFQIRDEDVGNIKLQFGSVQNQTPCIGDVVSTQCEVKILQKPENVKLEGKEFQLSYYLVDLLSDIADDRHGNTFGDLAEYTLSELAGDGRTVADVSMLDIPSIRYEEIPIAKLTVLKCKNLSDYYTLTCTDRLHFADRKYVSTLSYPTTSDKVVAEIADMIDCVAEREPAQSFLVSSDGKLLLSSEGHRLITSTWQFPILQKPVGYTMRQMIGFITAMRGKFAVIDRTGTLTQRWYSDGSGISFDYESPENDRHIDELELAETSVIINNLTCKVDEDTTLSTGEVNGRKMQFECPYMTGERLATLYAMTCHDYENEYYPCTFKQQLADPRFDVWDRLYDGNRQLLMLNMDYTFDGGLMLDVTSGGESDTESQAIGRY
ncbi:MAG: hypothetical protein Q4D35_03020 [Ruminococcus sp.]|nr:hypothetical protein [Ruminococcus sp.]